MQEELIITEADLASRFRGERDLITYAPYRVGDRVVRCGSCRAVIKSEFVTDRCPLCSSTPFRPAPVNFPASAMASSPARNVITAEPGRSLSTFLWLLLLSVAVAYIPFAFPEAADFLYNAAFGMAWGPMLISVGAISLLAAVILFFHEDTRSLWQNSDFGGWLLLGPIAAPYCVLAAVWAVVIAISLAIGLACIGLVIGIIASISQ